MVMERTPPAPLGAPPWVQMQQVIEELRSVSSKMDYIATRLALPTTGDGQAPVVLPPSTIEWGQATGGIKNKLVHLGKKWELHIFSGFIIKIIGGTGVDQTRTISDNTEDTITPAKDWVVNPDSTSMYAIIVPEVKTVRATLAQGQTKWSTLITRRVADGNALAANTSTTVSAYTVPVGYELYITGAMISCNVSCIQKVVMVHTPGIIGDYRYDVEGDIILGELSATILVAEETLTVYLYNNADKSADFSITILGILQKIAT